MIGVMIPTEVVQTVLRHPI